MTRRIIATCSYCNASFEKSVNEFNRAKRRGAPLYCNRKCAGLGRRKWKSDEEKKRAKAKYDEEYRARNKDKLKQKKAAYFQRTYDPAKAAIERKKRAHKHAEYCRRPEYRDYKKQYDRQYRAKKLYGDFWECFLLSMDIREYCLTVQSDYEIRYSKDGIGKAQERKRDYERTVSKHPESGPLGNLERGQSR